MAGLNKTAIVITVLLIMGTLIGLYMIQGARSETPVETVIVEERPRDWYDYTWPFATVAALPFWYGSARGYVPGPGPRPHHPLPPPPGPRPPHPHPRPPRPSPPPILPGPRPLPTPSFPTPALPRPTPLGPGARPSA